MKMKRFITFTGLFLGIVSVANAGVIAQCIFLENNLPEKPIVKVDYSFRDSATGKIDHESAFMNDQGPSWHNVYINNTYISVDRIHYSQTRPPIIFKECGEPRYSKKITLIINKDGTGHCSTEWKS